MAVCDVCDSSMNESDGLVLTTTEVAQNPRYWKHVFTHSWSYVHGMDPSGTMLKALAERQAAQDSGWLVCPSCAQLFAYNPEQARARAKESLNDPQKIFGKASSSASVLEAARRAWAELYGNGAEVSVPSGMAKPPANPVRELTPEVIRLDNLAGPESPSVPIKPAEGAQAVLPAQRSTEIPLHEFGVAVKESKPRRKSRAARFWVTLLALLLALLAGALVQYLALAGGTRSFYASVVGFFTQFANSWTDAAWPWIRGLFTR